MPKSNHGEGPDEIEERLVKLEEDLGKHTTHLQQWVEALVQVTRFQASEVEALRRFLEQHPNVKLTFESWRKACEEAEDHIDQLTLDDQGMCRTCGGNPPYKIVYGCHRCRRPTCSLCSVQLGGGVLVCGECLPHVGESPPAGGRG